MWKVISSALTGIILLSSGCQILDKDWRDRGFRLWEIGQDMKNGISNYHSKEFYEDEIACLKKRFDRLDERKTGSFYYHKCRPDLIGDEVWLDHDFPEVGESGDFAAAVKWQQKAIDLRTYDTDKETLTEYEERLKLYQSGKSYREIKQ